MADSFGPSVFRVVAAAILLSLTGGVSAGSSTAQTPRPLTRPAPHIIDQWTTREGLPQNSVNAIVQGSEGYLWLGTFGGLVRFDGTSFTVVDRYDAEGARRLDRVLALAADPGGGLWIGTEDAGLLRLRGGAYETFTRNDGLPSDEITALHRTAEGVLWIATAEGMASLVDGRIVSFREVEGLPVGWVGSFVESRDGRVWAVGGGRLLVARNGDVSIVRPAWTLPSPLLHVLSDDGEGGLWVSLSDRLARITEERAEVFDASDGTAMVREPGHGFWLGTSNDGLFFLPSGATAGAARRYALPDGRTSFRVRSAYVDRTGNVWVGTDANGLLRAKRNLFTAYARDNGLSHDVATAILAGSDGTIWVATNCGGVNAIDLEARTVRLFNPRRPGDPEGDPCVFSLAETPDGAIWQGSYGGGLTRLPRDGQPPRSVAALPDSVILALFTDRAGTLWVGTNSGGLAAVEAGRVRATYTTDDGLAHNSVRGIFEASDGELWIATLEGLSRFADGRFTDTIAPGLYTRALYEDADHNLWIGTYGAGLVLHRDGTSTAITSEHGLAEDVVSSIQEDAAGNLWTSGNRGIARVRRSDLIALADGAVDRVHSVLYAEADGLVSPETNGGFQPAASKDAQGRLWFPTLRGAAVVDPSDIAASVIPPSIRIDEIVVDGQSRPVTDTLVVPPGRPNVEIRYAGLGLTAPEHLTYRYRLEGLEPDWVEAGSRRVAYYPRLQPGRYRFVAGIADRDGDWSDIVAAVQLDVRPPFYRTRWFQLLIGLGLVGALWLALDRRERTARRAQAVREAFSRQLLESQEHERKRVASALHDSLGQQLLVVKNRALLALGSEDLGPEARAQLEEIDGVVSDSLADVRKLARDLTPHQLEHLGLTVALETMVESVADSAGIQMRTTIDPIDGLLSPEGEISLYRVVQEILNNIARHSGAERGAVRIRRTPDAIELAISDEGRGFRPLPAGEPGFGLSGIRERVRILGGRLNINSAPGRGTRVTATIPVVVDGGATRAAGEERP